MKSNLLADDLSEKQLAIMKEWNNFGKLEIA